MATPSVSQQTDTLNTIFLGLRNKSPDTSPIRSRITTICCHKGGRNVLRCRDKLWEDSINQRLFDLVHSPHSHDKLGGILAIDHLLDVDGEETIEFKHNLFRFYNYVKSLLPNGDLNIMLAASKTLGQIAEIGGAAFGEHFMDFEVPAAIGLLQGDKQEPGRYAGVLILKELARNSPVYFHSHIDLVFDKILMPIRDPRVIVREGQLNFSRLVSRSLLRGNDREGRPTCPRS
ncbi:hypothetical protein EDB85DRAFT_972866 [Lactarius pseudohatsudake]|nr:hypothetical protein EDB85DRAFT_972866 [Lactarius pseudohatsudake]